MEFTKYRDDGDYHWADYRAHASIYAQHADTVAEWITEHQVLDVGGGDGLIASLLIARGHAVLVVDNEPLAIAWAHRHGVPAVLATAEVVDRFGTWGAIYCGDTLEHLDNPGQALDIFHRVAPVLYIATPPRDEGGGLHDPFHTMEWTADELRALLAAHGWRETSTRTANVRILSRSERA